ncbi:hypothetical protein LY90DRAFT_514900 [Neocallimastix californiae]|uniref:CBS domain-containing protein n=1 Tax=Neocallimastix californiae TaxID=1754190 RepID=A0A1Y2AMK9_9FUNG|nr:hypothetical protein LY90DRAFT_514900 [Neocallimastix californiae]|eukprot:ORY23736.1 hypothetical protein LY90DRAFT_514900 [Neocallimastix californiae]
MDIITILNTTLCCNLIKGQIPITIDSSKSVEEGCKELVEHKFTSAPVVDKSTGKIVGILDYSPLSNAIDIFAGGIHRVLLEKEDGSLYGILSQSDIVKFLGSIFPIQIPGQQNNSIKWELGEKPIRLAKSEITEVICVDRYATVMDALRIMYNSSISSVAIVENVGSRKLLRGNISISDIKEVIKNNKWRHLWYPVGNFFEEIRKIQEFENNGRDKVPVYIASPETSVIKVIQKLAITKGHRIWIDI